MADHFLMRPKVDFAFKEIMMDEKARVGFLCAILKLDPADVKETRILNTDLRKLHADDKQGILDVRILLNNNTEIDTEIQLSDVKVWTNRSLFYLAKMYTDQIDAGQSYEVLKKCVSISILDFNLFAGEEAFYSCFHIREDTRHFLYTDKMEFHVIELRKLPREYREEGNSVLSWAQFINAERKEEFDMLSSQNPYIDSAYQRLQVISQDKRMRMEYDARQKAILDHNQMIKEADERGEKRGRAKGREEGIEIGQIKLAKALIARGVEKELIAAAADLTLEQLESLI